MMSYSLFEPTRERPPTDQLSTAFVNFLHVAASLPTAFVNFPRVGASHSTALVNFLHVVASLSTAFVNFLRFVASLSTAFVIFLHFPVTPVIPFVTFHCASASLWTALASLLHEIFRLIMKLVRLLRLSLELFL